MTLIHSTRAAVLLCGAWAVRWQDDGRRFWAYDRVVAVSVAGLRLLSHYAPLWGPQFRDELRTCRRLLEEQVVLARTAKEWLVIGGDFNASVGVGGPDIERSELAEARGRFGCGEMNAAGECLLRWCADMELIWANSFFRHRNRGT